MHLLACRMQNIGPFTDKNVLVRFHQGSHLIKAPIGSGKSFLFFDGPLFGLYKHRNRQILNKNSKKGEVHVLIEHDQSYRYIVRSLTATKKGGESIKTTLFELHESQIKKLDSITDTLTRNTDLKQILSISANQQIEFTTTREADQSIIDLLPPKEVTMSIHFLMQESVSVFELLPAERVRVFKHLFGLIGLDDAKDKVQDAKRTLQAELTVYKEHSRLDQKLQTSLQSLLSHISTSKEILSNPLLEDYQETIVPNSWTFFGNSTFQDLSQLPIEQLSLEGFSLKGVSFEQLDTLQDLCQQEIQSLSSSVGGFEQLEKQLSEEEKQKTTLQTTINTTIKQIDKNEHLSKETTKREKELITMKTSLQQIEIKQQHTNDQLPRDKIEPLPNEKTKPESISEFEKLIQESIERGKLLTEQINSLQKNIVHTQQQQKTREQHEQNLQEQHKNLTETKDSQSVFHCDKIEGNCPYIDLINTAAKKGFDKQLEVRKQHYTKHQSSKQDRNKTISFVQTEKKQKESEIEQIRSFLGRIQRKACTELFTTYKALSTQKEQSLRSLTALQSKIETIRQQQQQIQKDKARLEQLQSSLLELTTRQQKRYEERKTLSQKNFKETAHILGDYKKQLQAIQTDLLTTKQLIEEYTQQQLTYKQKEKELGRVKDLYQIFTKELMVIVLQDFLPSLQQIINSYLAQIVEFEVHFIIPQDQGEKLELDIEIVDQKGKRSVTSLSGGQKAILKLVRMLSVTTLMKSSFLLLDETINNIDSETVSTVADILEDFVVSRSISMYVVTHSKQIQEMDIWDGDVVLE